VILSRFSEDITGTFYSIIILIVLIGVLIHIYRKNKLANARFIIDNYPRKGLFNSNCYISTNNYKLKSDDIFSREFNKRVDEKSMELVNELKDEKLKEDKLIPFLDRLSEYKRKIESRLIRGKIKVYIYDGDLNINMYWDDTEKNRNYLDVKYDLIDQRYSIYSNYETIDYRYHSSYGKGEHNYFKDFEEAFNFIIKSIADFVAR
jgi:hypothetical protein